jgi:hypothetical protein
MVKMLADLPPKVQRNASRQAQKIFDERMG